RRPGCRSRPMPGCSCSAASDRGVLDPAGDDVLSGPECPLGRTAGGKVVRLAMGSRVVGPVERHPRGIRPRGADDEMSLGPADLDVAAVAEAEADGAASDLALAPHEALGPSALRAFAET